MIDAFIASVRYRNPSQQLVAIAHHHQIDQLDGRGLATLMKHMAASGLSSEAWEIFEFFKEQQGNGRCDVFVYTVSSSSRVLYRRPLFLYRDQKMFFDIHVGHDISSVLWWQP